MRGDEGKIHSWLVLLLVGVGVVAVVTLSGLRVGAPQIEIAADRPGIGPATTIRVLVSDEQRELGRVAVELIQGESRIELGVEEGGARRSNAWQLWRRLHGGTELVVVAGAETIPSLVEGEARIRVSARPAPTWLRHPPAVVEELTLPVRLHAPGIDVLCPRIYAAQGGAEAVVYRLRGEAARHGVQAGEWFFPGYPLPNDPSRWFALFAVPWDVDDGDEVRLVVEDELGNEANRPFLDRFTPRPVRTGRIELSDAFLERVVPPILERNPDLEAGSTLLEGYLAINGELRRQNRELLRELALQSATEFLWQGPFRPFPNGAVMSPFAVRRSYLYEGRQVDEQTHLGFDLASTRQAPVPAANRGRVVWADFLGIYGNVVVLDHGFGLMTLYAHLSSFDVSAGEMVEAGTSVGRTGATGLAGGDHLHFATLLGGLPTTPVEWWDGHWIADRVDLKLGTRLAVPEE